MLVEEESRCASLETRVHNLTSGLEAQKSATEEEKNRVLLAEQELNALRQAKTQSEQDLNQVITGLKETARQQAAGLARLKNDMEAETSRRVMAEQELNVLRQAKTQSEQDLNQVITGLKETAQQQAAGLARLKNDMEAETSRQVMAEQELNALKQAKTQSEQDLNQVITGLKETAQQQAAGLARLKNDMEAETSRRVMAENQAASLRKELEQSRTPHPETEALSRQVGTLQESLTASAAALKTERELRLASEEQTKAAVRQKEDLEKYVRTAGQEMERAKKDQAAIIVQLGEELKSAGQQIKSLETDIKSLTAEKLQPGQDVLTRNPEPGHEGTLLPGERKGHPGLTSHILINGTGCSSPSSRQMRYQSGKRTWTWLFQESPTSP